MTSPLEPSLDDDAAEPRRRRGAVFFDCTEAPDVLVEGLASRLAVPEVLRSSVDIERYFHHSIWKQPLVREGTLCLSGFYFAPDFTMPLHAPPAGYMAWVWEGSLCHSSGGAVLKHGGGFYARPDQPYGFTSGPTGVRLILFGPTAAVPEDFLGPGTAFPPDTASWLVPFSKGAAEHGTTFFDWNEQPQYLFEHLERRRAVVPDAIREQVDLEQFFEGWYWGQPLPIDPGTDVRPGSYYQAPNSRLPRHRHMNECVYFITEGSLVQGNRTSKPGGGWYGPPANPYAVGAGPSGMRMMELHVEGELQAVDDPLPEGVRTKYLDSEPSHWVAPPIETMHPDPVTTTRRYNDVARISQMSD